MATLSLSPDQLEALRRLDTCLVANAIETFRVRLRNEGFTNAPVRCLFPHLPTMLGHAVTLKVRSSAPPMTGNNYLERTDWWNFILSIPAPRVILLQDVDAKPGEGSLLGEVHANILRALGCVGAVTNGAVRDVPAAEALGFQFFAGNVTVSHSYAHIVEIGGPVEVGGLKVSPGELLHGDVHGVITIPPKIAAEIPAAAAEIVEKERKLIALCRSKEFSLEKLRETVAKNSGAHHPHRPTT